MKMSRTRMLQFAWLFTLILAGILPAANGEEKKYQSSTEYYRIPDVTLINQNGKKIRFRDVMQSDKPVVVDFIFCSCTTICPVLSASFINLQNKLGDESRKVNLVSISIDPEHDRPKIMKEYLRRYRAKPGWDFLTGSKKDIESIRRSFDAYVTNKMAHQPLVLIRKPKDNSWIRIFGITSTEELLTEIKKAGA